MRPTARNDEAVAAVVGIVLLLAIAVTAYANAVRDKLPIYGEEAENAWSEAVASAFRGIALAAADGATSGSAGTVVVPKPPPPKSIDLPLLGSAAPHSPSGAIRFEPSCAGATASHTLLDGSLITDLAGSPGGCVVFEATPVYSRTFGYVYEHGGVLRIQAGNGVVLSGPPLELDATSPIEYRVSLTAPGLRGRAIGVSTETADAHIDVVPGPSAAEVEQAPNAASATWTLTTANPTAWKTWLEARFAQAGFVAHRSAPGPGVSDADYTVTCDPVDCSLLAGVGRVIVHIEGPRTDVNDVKLSLTYGLADFDLR